MAWLCWLAAVALLVAALAPRSARSDEHSSTEVRVLSARGAVDPVMARYVEREIGRAEADGAKAVVVELDTPGGLDASMREIVQTLLDADVPVAVHVAPAGARAASAGMFVTLAASVAAMAPGTAIGAAHPVIAGGGRDVDPTTEAKAVNDAAALARAIATLRHRNADWPERAVRESVSLTSDEALREGVVDIVAADLDDLLRQLDGRRATTASGERTVHTAGTIVVERPMPVNERLVQIVSDPNVAYLLFLLGLLGIAAELYHPGTFIPGTIGAVALVLALVAFGNLPISWAGVLLILLAIGLFVGELQTGTGALAVVALVALVVGSLLIYSPPEGASPGPAVRVSLGIVVLMSAVVAGFFLFVVRATLRTRHLAVQTGIPVLVGRTGVATSELAPAGPVGTVRVDGEVWSAEPEGEVIHAGEDVTVLGGSGVTLRVARSQSQARGRVAAWNRSSQTPS